jgi:tetratricopeptide (TPR) repeat protein
MLLQGLAIALSAAGRDGESLAAYEQAEAEARRAGDARMEANALRNHGLLLAQLERFAEAQARLEAAVRAAEVSGDDEMTGRGEVALGIFYQHRGWFDQAHPVLERGLGRLPPSHPDTVYARGHLTALADGSECPCRITPEALAEQLRQHIIRSLPAGLLKDVQISLPGEGKDADVRVEVDREPTAEELEQLQVLVNQAYLTFRSRMTRPS